MKIVTDFSVTSRPLRVGAGFSPLSLFAEGETGAYLLVLPPDRAFADLDGLLSAAFGQSLARIDDLSANALHAIQPNAAQRPLLGRAPLGAATGGPVDQGSGLAVIRFDLADDVLPVAFPDGGTFDVMLFGRQGSWIERDVTIAPAGSLNIGPETFTGAPKRLMHALDDIVGWVAVDRTITADEVARLARYHKARGAKGLLVPGPELLANNDFMDGDTGWTLNDGWSVSEGLATKDWPSGSDIAQFGPLVPHTWYLAELNIAAVRTTSLVFVGPGSLNSQV